MIYAKLFVGRNLCITRFYIFVIKIKSFGTSEDINCNDIIVFNIYRIGRPFTSKEHSIANFLEHSSATFPVESCKILYYSCPIQETYNCWKCSHFKDCQFWNDRSKVQFCELK